MVSSFTIALCGPSKCGKTSFIEFIKTGYFTNKYHPTTSVKETQLIFKTTVGDVELTIMDFSGQRAKKYIRQDLMFADAVIVMFDLTKQSTDLSWWLSDIEYYCNDNIPTIICGNKSDVKHKQPNMEEYSRYRYFNTNCKQFGNVEPFEHLIKTLIGNFEMQIIE